MMETKVLLIDMDGVICQYDRRILELAHARFGLPLYQPEEVSLFDTHEIFGDKFSSTVEKLALEPGFFSSLAPMDGAVEAFSEIMAASHEYDFKVFICTTAKRFYKNHQCFYEKGEWLSKHLGKESTDRLIFTRDKTLVRGTMLVDDKPEVTGCITPSWEHVHFDKPYNRGKPSRRLMNWSSWRETLLPSLV